VNTESAPATTALYTLLHIGGLRLAFAQRQVAMVEIAAAIRVGDKQGREVGALALRHGRLPVYAPEPDLTPATVLAPQRRFCVCFNVETDQRRAFALACDAVQTLRIDESRVLALPECMHSAINPLQHMVKQGQGLVFISGATAMGRYFSYLEQSQ
jgi:hypothetical protein